MAKEPTDCEHLLTELKRAGLDGVHSHDIRRWGISGNPSQRIKDLETKGYEFKKIRENRGKRPGVRYILLSEPQAGSSGRGTAVKLPRADDAVGDAKANPNIGSDKTRTSGRSLRLQPKNVERGREAPAATSGHQARKSRASQTASSSLGAQAQVPDRSLSSLPEASGTRASGLGAQQLELL